VAIEIQGNLDALLSWLKQNYRQVDDTPNMTTRLLVPSDGGATNARHVVTLSEMVATIPTGVIMPYGGSSSPDTDLWAICNGASRPTTDNLFNVIGFKYGNPGSGQYSLPDFRSRFMRGAPTPTTTPLPQGGSDLLAAHTHVQDEHFHTMPTHNHGMGNHTHSSGPLTVTLGGTGNAIYDMRAIEAAGGFSIAGNTLGGFLWGNSAAWQHTGTPVSWLRTETAAPWANGTITLDVGGNTGQPNDNLTGNTDPGNTNPRTATNRSTGGGDSGNVPAYTPCNFLIRL